LSESIRTQQEPLFVESLEEAIEATAMACGGKKAFACAVRPDLEDEPEKAHRWLLDCLNGDRRTELHPNQVIRACRIGRENGCHILKHWIDDATGYERARVAPAKTPEQDLAEKMRKAAADFSRLADEHAAIERQRAVREIRAAS